MTWAPILAAPMRLQAIDAVTAVAELLRSRVPDPPRIAGEAAGLPGGAAGEALLYAYLARSIGSSRDVERAGELVEVAAAALADEVMGPGLLEGIVGIAWVVQHLCADDPDDPAAPIDDLIETLVAGTVPPNDLAFGLAGFAVHLLERKHHAGAVGCLVRVVAELESRAETSDRGTTWSVGVDHLSPSQREIAPDGLYDLGVSHGIAGIVATLARIHGETELRTPALAEAIRWLCAQRRTDRSQFPSVVIPGREPTPSRLSWCRGDPGIAAALLLTASAIGDSTLEADAIDVARSAATRTEQVGEPHLCHGTAGLGHLFNRMYQATGDTTLGRAASAWFERTLATWQPGGTRGFLQGDVGIALALLAASTDVEPAWDRVLLASVPPR